LKRFNLYITFEFDEAKSQSNLVKHGIDFFHAQDLWRDPDRVTVRAKTVDESRFVVIGKIDGKIWSAVITIRGWRIRIISVRRARKSEEALYEC